jgi:hypothetical protein
MNVARSLERRLERLLEGVFSRVFSGRLHASEIAGRIAREADLARFQHASGPGTANSYTLTFNPADIGSDDAELADSLTQSFAEYAADVGGMGAADRSEPNPGIEDQPRHPRPIRRG